jgi:hypothetical protein
LDVYALMKKVAWGPVAIPAVGWVPLCSYAHTRDPLVFKELLVHY